MASFTERIRLIFDVDANPATKGFGSFAKSIREAEGFTGKLKAGIQGVNQAGSAFALAGGAALISVALKGADAFVKLSKASIDLGKTVGTTTEDASRWIAVADDAGVSAEDLQAGMGKIAKTLDSGKWDEYGIATRDASGHVRSTNDIMLDALDVLSKTKDETERARIGAELFGKGYGAIAPLVGQTRAEYEKMLGAVSDGQVITDAEAEKAEKLRLAQDNLGDALKNVEMALGSVLSAASPLVNFMASSLGTVAGWTDALFTTGGRDLSLTKDLKDFQIQADKSLGGAAADAKGYMRDIGDAFDNLVISAWNKRDNFTTLSDAMQMDPEGQIAAQYRVLKDQFHDLAQSAPEMAQKVYSSLELQVQGSERGVKSMQKYTHEWGLNRDTLAELKDLMPGVTKEIDKAAEATDEARKRTSELYAAIQKLNGAELNAESAMFSYQDALDKVWTTTDDAKTSVNEHTQAVHDAEVAAEDYAKALANKSGAEEGSTENTRLQIDALSDMVKTIGPDTELGKRLQAYIDKLKEIPGSISTGISVEGIPVGGAVVPFAGGNSPSGVVIQNAYFNTTAKLSPEEVARLMKEWERRTGLKSGQTPRNAR